MSSTVLLVKVFSPVAPKCLLSSLDMELPFVITAMPAMVFAATVMLSMST
jgi:hypothetical protein